MCVCVRYVQAVAAALRDVGRGAQQSDRPLDFSHIADRMQRLQEFLVTYTRAVSDVRALEGQMGPVVQDSTVTEVRNIEVGMIVVRGRDWRSGDVDGCSWGVVTKCNAGQYGRTRVLWNATGLETVHVTTQSGSELREAPAWAKNGR